MPTKELSSPLDRNGDQDLFNFGGGADTITVVDGPIGYIINSGGGDDNVTGSLKADNISGGDGDDTLTGGGGGDTIYGGEASEPEKVSKNGGPASNKIYGDYKGDEFSPAITSANLVTAGFATDWLYGGDHAGNTIYGDAYQFNISGGDDVTNAADTIVGGAGDGVNTPMQELFGDVYGLNVNEGGTYTGGGDIITGGDLTDNTIYGDANTVAVKLNATINGGDDTITGGDGDGVLSIVQILYGDTATFNSVGTGEFNGGVDTISGGANTENEIYGDFKSTTGSGLAELNGGNDTLTGGDGSTNTIFGDGQSYLTGGAFEGGDDFIYGGAGGVNNLYGDLETFNTIAAEGDGLTFGNDVITGGAGAVDWMYGDYDPTLAASAIAGGADRFVIGLNGGEDHIMDFRQGDLDRVDLSAYGFLSLADLAGFWVGDGGKLALNFGEGNTLTFENIAYTGGPVPLVEEDFIFAIV